MLNTLLFILHHFNIIGTCRIHYAEMMGIKNVNWMLIRHNLVNIVINDQSQKYMLSIYSTLQQQFGTTMA